jgi:trigger factor
MASSAKHEKIELEVEVEETGAIQRGVRVTVPSKRVSRAFEKAYKQLGRQVVVKGFRPGKAPRSVLEKLYGPSIAEDVERTVVSETLADAFAQADLEPVSEPSIDAPLPENGEPLVYTATVEVKPTISLPELTGLPASRPVVSVDEDAVDTQINHLRERQAPLVDEAPETEAATGHYLTIDYVGRIDGEAFEGGSGQGVTLELGSNRFIPGFEEQLEGAKADEDREVRVTFPEDYGHAELAGKEARFAVHVAKLQRRELPTVDDAFAKEVGDHESVDALRASLRADLESQQERQAEAELRRTLLDSLLERTEFEAPAGMVDRQLNHRLEMAARQLGGAFGDQLPEQLARWREEWRESAEREVREHLVLEAVADAKGFEASDEDLDGRLEQIARDQGIDLERLRTAYEEPGMTDALRSEIASERALDFLRSEAKVEEVTGT